MTAESAPQHLGVVVVGAGFGGLAAAHALKARGEEFARAGARAARSAACGGTTPIRAAPATSRRICTRCRSRPTRTGPGPSPPSPRSATTCAGSPASTDYCRTSASAAACYEAAWDDAAQLWRIETSAGAVTADVLIDASGPIADPSIPDLPGLDGFTGAVFHSAPLEPRPRSDRPQRRGRRHRRLGDPVRARRSSRW